MGDHHVGDPFFAPPNPNPRPAGPPVPASAPQPPAPTPAAPASTVLPSVEESLADVPVVPTVTPHPPQAEQTPQPPPVPAVSRTELYSMRLERLKETAAARGLDTTGKRPALIARIKEWDDARRNTWDTEVPF